MTLLMARFFKIRPFQGKAQMSTSESWNARLRPYHARPHRKTHCYSKRQDLLRWSIQLFLAEKCVSISSNRWFVSLVVQRSCRFQVNS